MGKLSDFEVVYEVTHHGPTNLRKPLTFVEIGSSETEWTYEKAHEVVGESVVKALREFRYSVNCVPTVGSGDRITLRDSLRELLDTGNATGT